MLRPHEVKLFYGTQELKDATPVQIELQAVDTLAPAKIVATIVDKLRLSTWQRECGGRSAAQ